MFKKIFMLLTVVMLGASLAWAGYSIKSMTPEVKEALEGRKERFAELRALKTSGAIGENNRGYVEALKAEGNVKTVVAQENRDRRVIYQTIAQQNGLEGALSTIESAFAQVQADKAESGDRIQQSNGAWIVK